MIPTDAILRIEFLMSASMEHLKRSNVEDARRLFDAAYELSEMYAGARRLRDDAGD